MNTAKRNVIVLGCTGFMGCSTVVTLHLVKAGLSGVPVIDPIPLTVNMALAICNSGLRHSRRGWGAPAKKPIGGFAALQSARG